MKRPVIIIFAFLLFLGMACSKIATDNTVESIPQISQKSDIWLMEDMSDRMVPGEQGGGQAVANFQEEGSKIHTELSSDGTYVQVVWNANDSFDMIAYNTETGNFPYTVYTTAQGGVNASFTYSNTIFIKD